MKMMKKMRKKKREGSLGGGPSSSRDDVQGLGVAHRLHFCRCANWWAAQLGHIQSPHLNNWFGEARFAAACALPTWSARMEFRLSTLLRSTSMYLSPIFLRSCSKARLALWSSLNLTYAIPEGLPSALDIMWTPEIAPSSALKKDLTSSSVAL